MQLRGQSLQGLNEALREGQVFFSASDETAIAFGETFPSNIYCLLTVICYCPGRVYFPPQPARNMKFASGPLDFILSYFSVFSEENSFSRCFFLSARSGRVWSCHLALLHQHFSDYREIFFCSSPCSSTRDSLLVLTACP